MIKSCGVKWFWRLPSMATPKLISLQSRSGHHNLIVVSSVPGGSVRTIPHHGILQLLLSISTGDLQLIWLEASGVRESPPIVPAPTICLIGLLNRRKTLGVRWSGPW